MKKVTNLAIILLLAVWSFIAGGQFHQGWMNEPGIDLSESFIIGGIAMVVALGGFGFIIYRFLKRSGAKRPTIAPYIFVGFFTLVFLGMAQLKSEEIDKKVFIENFDNQFIRYYQQKLKNSTLYVPEFYSECDRMISLVELELIIQSEKDIAPLLNVKSNEKLFGKGSLIHEICLDALETGKEGFTQGFRMLIQEN